MKPVLIEPTLNNQSNDAYINPMFTITMVNVPKFSFTPQTSAKRSKKKLKTA